MKESVCECKTTAWKPLYAAPDFDTGEYQRSLRSCSDCGITQTYPLPNASDITQAYDENYYTSTGAKFNAVIEAWSRRAGRSRARKLLRQSKAENAVLNVLDFGCGRGVLLEGFKAEGHNVKGIERPGSGFDSLADISTESLHALIVSGQRFDLIVVWHVLEHLDAPENTIAELRQLLTANGKLYVEVPNFGSIQARLFKGHWFHLDIPRHLAHFTADSLTGLMHRNKLKVSQTKTFSFDQNLYGFIQSALNTLPMLPENHLYGVLKSGLSLKNLVIMVLYSPILAILTGLAAAELSVSQIVNRGAVLSLELVKTDD